MRSLLYILKQEHNFVMRQQEKNKTMLLAKAAKAAKLQSKQEDQDDELFQPSETFQGAQLNMVFRSGTQGVGYYTDKTKKINKKIQIENEKAKDTVVDTDADAIVDAVVPSSSSSSSSSSALSTTSSSTSSLDRKTKTVLKKRMVDVTKEDDFGFTIVEQIEEEYEEEVVIDGIDGNSDISKKEIDQGVQGVQGDVASVPETSAENTEINLHKNVTIETNDVDDMNDADKDKDDNKDDDEDEEEEEEEEEDEVAPKEKKDKNAQYRAMLEAERNKIRTRKQKKAKVDGMFDEEASEEEDEEVEGLGNFGDDSKKRKRYVNKML